MMIKQLSYQVFSEHVHLTKTKTLMGNFFFFFGEVGVSDMLCASLQVHTSPYWPHLYADLIKQKVKISLLYGKAIGFNFITSQ